MHMSFQMYKEGKKSERKHFQYKNGQSRKCSDISEAGVAFLSLVPQPALEIPSKARGWLEGRTGRWAQSGSCVRSYCLGSHEAKMEALCSTGAHECEV